MLRYELPECSLACGKLAAPAGSKLSTQGPARGILQESVLGSRCSNVFCYPAGCGMDVPALSSWGTLCRASQAQESRAALACWSTWQQESQEVQCSLIQSPAPGIADCLCVGKNLGSWPVTNQICASPVYLCQERSGNISKRADRRVREASVPSCERERVFQVLSPVWGLLGDSSREASPAEF